MLASEVMGFFLGAAMSLDRAEIAQGSQAQIGEDGEDNGLVSAGAQAERT